MVGLCWFNWFRLGLLIMFMISLFMGCKFWCRWLLVDWGLVLLFGLVWLIC